MSLRMVLLGLLLLMSCGVGMVAAMEMGLLCMELLISSSSWTIA